MDQEDLKNYQELRASQGLPEISDKDALVEAQALVNFMTLGIKWSKYYRKDNLIPSGTF